MNCRLDVGAHLMSMQAKLRRQRRNDSWQPRDDSVEKCSLQSKIGELQTENERLKQSKETPNLAR